jgi:hypothetical protein
MSTLDINQALLPGIPDWSAVVAGGAVSDGGFHPSCLAHGKLSAPIMLLYPSLIINDAT